MPLEQRRSSLADLADLVVRLRVPLALVVLGTTSVNRLVLHQVDLPRDVAYLLVGWLPAGGGTLELPWEAPWLVLPVAALVLFVARPRAWTWGAVVVAFVLPHVLPYSVGPMQIWGSRVLDTSPTVLQLLHVPLLVLLAVLGVLVVGGRRTAPSPTGVGPSDAVPAPTPAADVDAAATSPVTGRG